MPGHTISSRADRWSLGRLAVAGGACTGAAFAVARLGHPVDDPERWATGWLGAWAVFAVAAGFALHGASPSARSSRLAALVLVLGAVGCQLPGLTAPPQTSTDAYRYVWDGRVQLSGTSPYRYAPADDALAHLRDPLLFPGLDAEAASGLATVRPLPREPGALRELTRNDQRIAINRPQVPTVYPPVAQAWFTAVAAVTPWTAGTFGLQAASAVLAVVITVVLVRLLRRTGRDPRWAALWGWSPLVATEASSNAHVDVVSAALVVAACAVLGLDQNVRGRVVGGALLGLAVATKVMPLVLLPALAVLRRDAPGGPRRQLLVPLSTAGATAATYVPHVLAAGSLVVGYLPSYLVEEGFDDGRSRFGVIALLPLPVEARWPVALGVAAVAVLIAVRSSDPRRPWDSACWLLGAALLVATPAYPWYALPLVGLAALARRPEWLAVPVAAGWAYVLQDDLTTARHGWAVAAVVVVASLSVRAAASRSKPT